jgi:hypothetical protein
MRNPKVLDESVIFIADVPALYPHAKIKKRNIGNWLNIGIVNRSTGDRFTLEWAKVGGNRVTSKEAMERFLRNINAKEEAEYARYQW